MIVGQDRVTDEVERLLLVVIKTFYARDTQVRGLADLPVAQLRVLNVLGRSAEERTPTMGELADALGVRAEHRDARSWSGSRSAAWCAAPIRTQMTGAWCGWN